MSDRASSNTLRVIAAAACLVTSGCLMHAPGLTVEVELALEPPRALAGAQITLLELLPCPGTTSPATHTHDETAPWSIDLRARERALLSPRRGRYCDLRLEVEVPALPARQAVLPLTCRGTRTELALDESMRSRSPRITIRGAAAEDAGDGGAPRALERLLRGTLVSTCDANAAPPSPETELP